MWICLCLMVLALLAHSGAFLTHLMAPRLTPLLCTRAQDTETLQTSTRAKPTSSAGPTGPAAKATQCPACGSSFASRNQFFLHLRNSACTQALSAASASDLNSASASLTQSGSGSGSLGARFQRRSVLLSVGYSGSHGNSGSPADASDQVEVLLREALGRVGSRWSMRGGSGREASTGAVGAVAAPIAPPVPVPSPIASLTRATATRYRNTPLLSQAASACALGDSVVFSEMVQLPLGNQGMEGQGQGLGTVGGDMGEGMGASIPDWIDAVNTELASLVQQGVGRGDMQARRVAVLGRQELGPSEALQLHAEQHCTVRAYEYLLPLRALLPPASAASVETHSHTRVQLTAPETAVLSRRLKQVLLLILGPRPADRGGYKYRFSEQQRALRKSRRWHNYYCADAGAGAGAGGTGGDAGDRELNIAPMETAGAETGTGAAGSVVAAASVFPVAPTEKAALRAVDKFYSLGTVSLPKVRVKETQAEDTIRTLIGPDRDTDANTDTNTDMHADTEPYFQLRIIGDGFLTGQVRAMVGLAVCVMQGWLPEDFIPYSQEAGVLTEMPRAPPLPVMLIESRYDWHYNKIPRIPAEASVGVNAGGDVGKGGSVVQGLIQQQNQQYQQKHTTAWRDWAGEQRLRDDLWAQVSASSPGGVEEWLRELREEVCPRILARRDKMQSYGRALGLEMGGVGADGSGMDRDGDGGDTKRGGEWDRVGVEETSASSLSAPSSSFPSSLLDPVEVEREAVSLKCARVLRLLREADDSGAWPTTTVARQRVISKQRGVEDAVAAGAAAVAETGAAEGQKQEQEQELEKVQEKVGSFSVGRPIKTHNTPRGNTLFAELVEAVFELETTLRPHRPSSTMAAINRRAQFLPHRDAGAGFGQSTSMIVGLGDYCGGQLAIEQEVVDIRYRGVEFDGWQQMHWTLPFKGERFSIVWFSPADREI